MRIAGLLLGWVVAAAHGAELVDIGDARKIAEVNRLRVVDARGAADRSQFPVAGAIAYERALKLADKRVLVIGDADGEALAAAQALERDSAPLAAFALRGGYETLRALRPGARLPPLTDGAMPPSYTIPSDTCQTGPALHTYENDR